MMLLKNLELLASNENRARRYLVKKAWEGKRRFCVRCRSMRIYRLAEKRYRCARCGYTFHDFSGRWVGRLNLKAKQWLWLLKLFELEVPARRVASEVGISYPTALKAIDFIRCAIAQQTRSESAAESNWLDEYYSGCRVKSSRSRYQPSGRSPIFGVVERGGQIELTLAKDIGERTLRNANVPTARMGPIVYTGRVGSFDGLLFWSNGDLKLEDDRRSDRRQLESKRLDGFWNFAKERIQRVPKQRLPIYLKELEFRYNHRHENLFDLLASCVTQLVPNPL